MAWVPCSLRTETVGHLVALAGTEQDLQVFLVKMPSGGVERRKGRADYLVHLQGVRW